MPGARKESGKALSRAIVKLQSDYAIRQQIARSQGDGSAYRNIDVRRKYLSRLARQLTEPDLAPTVFVAYSGTDDGGDYFGQTSAILVEHEFKVLTGFDKQVRMDPNQKLLKAIRKRIELSTLFLGIWTPDYWVSMQKDKGKGGKTEKWGVPSVWMPAELGIAVAENKPFVLLVDERIHQDFYTKIWGGRPHFLFSSKTFPERLSEAMEVLTFKYHGSIVGDIENDFGDG